MKYWNKIVKYFEKCDMVFYGLFDHKFSQDIESQKRVYVTDGRILFYFSPEIYDMEFATEMSKVFVRLDEKNNGFKYQRNGKNPEIKPDDLSSTVKTTINDVSNYGNCYKTSMMFNPLESGTLAVFKSMSDLIAVNILYQELAENMSFYPKCILTGDKRNKPIHYSWYGQGVIILPVYFDVKTTAECILEV